MFGLDTSPLTLIVVLGGLSLLPFIAIMLTSYVKLVVVFNLLRSAMGLSGVPSNMVLNGFAIILTVFIMSPVGAETMELAKVNEPLEIKNIETLTTFVDKVSVPLRQFLIKHSSLDSRVFFQRAAGKLWPPKHVVNLDKESLTVLVPSFMLTELKRAFQIGLLLYLPFIVLDLVVANILMAMGMMMVMPSTISMPFKLLLFVSLDGWTRITQGLVLSYR